MSTAENIEDDYSSPRKSRTKLKSLTSKSPVRSKIRKSNVRRTRWGNQYGAGYVDGFDMRSSLLREPNK
jgi:hypothetical protein